MATYKIYKNVIFLLINLLNPWMMDAYTHTVTTTCRTMLMIHIGMTGLPTDAVEISMPLTHVFEVSDSVFIKGTWFNA